MHSQQRQDELKALLKSFDEQVVAARLRPSTRTSSLPVASSSPLAGSSSPLPGSSLPLPVSPRTRTIPAELAVKHMVKVHIYIKVSSH